MTEYYLGRSARDKDYILIEAKAPYRYDWFGDMPTRKFDDQDFSREDPCTGLPAWTTASEGTMELLGIFTRETLPTLSTHPELFI